MNLSRCTTREWQTLALSWNSIEGVFFNGLVTANMQKVLEVRVRCCACVWGNVLASGERGFQE